MQVTLTIPEKYDNVDSSVLEEKLNQNIEQILFELELLTEYYEAKNAPKSRFHNV